MAFRLTLTLIMGAFIWCSGCKKPSPAQPPQPPAQQPVPQLPQFHMNEAQPKLPTIQLWIGSQALDTEIAHTPTQLATGMMFRSNMAENEAMLFIFLDAGPRSFYMRNTKLPLSLAYIDPQGAILEIHDLKPLDETPVFSKSDRIQYVLETRQGWFERHNITVGTTIRTEAGPLYETFFKK
jgi:uncharacterized protein